MCLQASQIRGHLNACPLSVHLFVIKHPRACQQSVPLKQGTYNSWFYMLSNCYWGNQAWLKQSCFFFTVK